MQEQEEQSRWDKQEAGGADQEGEARSRRSRRSSAEGATMNMEAEQEGQTINRRSRADGRNKE